MRALWAIPFAVLLALAGCEPDAEDPTEHRDVQPVPKPRGGPEPEPEPEPTPTPTPDPTPTPAPEPTPSPEPTPTPEPPPTPEPTPAPTPLADCGLDIDDEGFFVRLLADGVEYVGFLPSSYSATPTRLFVGLHGCGDDAGNFAEWAVNPEETRGEQEHIGISVENVAGGGCWSDDEIPRVLRAIEDVSSCVHVDPRKIVVGGYSSGGELAYALGLRHASRFSGILVENASLSRAGDPDDLIEDASWLLPIAHVAHTDDGAYPIGDVREDWDLLAGAGFPLDTLELDGDHDGSTDDWLWLLSRIAEWESPE